MKVIKKNYLLILVGLFLFSCNQQSKTPTQIEAPVAKKQEKKLIQHGHERIDNYYWLNERSNPEVIAHLEAENAYANEMLKSTEVLQSKLFEEMKARISEDDKSVPYFLNGYFYYNRFEKGKEYPIHCRKKGTLETDELIMLDVNVLAEGKAYCGVNSLSVSPDNKILAYGIDTVSRRQYQIRFKDMESGTELRDVILNTEGSAAWAADNKTVFYSRKDTVTLRSYQIYKHTLGTPVQDDKLIYQENDETFGVYVYTSKDEKYIIIASSSSVSDEYRLLKSDNPDGEFTIFQARERGLEYSIEHYNNEFYIRTNYKALNFNVMKTLDNKTSKENWKNVMPYNDSIFTEGIEIMSDYLVIQQKVAGIGNLFVYHLKSKKSYGIDFEEEVFSADMTSNTDPKSKVLRFSYTSLTTPTEIYDYNLETKERVMLKKTEVIGNFNKNDYESKRLYAKASDGTLIPVSIVYKKGLNIQSGQNPTLIYAYGSYGYSLDPYFSSTRLSLLDRGFIYAIAHVRGGQEMGRSWYDDGKLMNKMNTFTDFIAISEHLINQKYTSPEHLFAWGGSAGGLLVGAVANMAPQLYKGIIAEVPFVDVVTTMLDESIPLTTGEFDEWGNPKDSAAYWYMLSYSPYDNVKATAYPNILVTSGLYDSQVQYFEPAKWVAKLREMKTDNNLLLFSTNMDAGHGGASGRFQALKEYATQFAFLFMLLDIKE
jgi:oligopeptidase B